MVESEQTVRVQSADLRTQLSRPKKRRFPNIKHMVR